MLEWIVRILFILAAPIAALLISRDELHFGLVQTFVAMFLVIGCIGLAATWSGRGPRARS